MVKAGITIFVILPSAFRFFKTESGTWSVYFIFSDHLTALSSDSL